jgi:hypothetical protein
MTVKAIIAFYDIKEGVTRNEGDTFAVSEERYQQLLSSKFGKLVEKVAEATEKSKEPKQSRKAGKSR